MPTELLVRRLKPVSTHTPGELLWGLPASGQLVHECWTCEPPQGPGVDGKVRLIPAGRYRLSIRWSKRFQQDMPHVEGVPGFEGIEIHVGNTAKDTIGCLLVGRGLTPTGVSESRLAFGAFVPRLKEALVGGPVWITYQDAPTPAT